MDEDPSRPMPRLELSSLQYLPQRHARASSSIHIFARILGSWYRSGGRIPGYKHRSSKLKLGEHEPLPTLFSHPWSQLPWDWILSALVVRVNIPEVWYKDGIASSEEEIYLGAQLGMYTLVTRRFLDLFHWQKHLKGVFGWSSM